MSLSQWTPETFATEASTCLRTRRQSLAESRLTTLLSHVQDKMLANTALEVKLDSTKEIDIEWILNDFRAWISPVASVKCKNASGSYWEVYVALHRSHLETDVLDSLDPALFEFWMITMGQWKARRLGDILKQIERDRTYNVAIKAEEYTWVEVPWFNIILVPFLQAAGFEAYISMGYLHIQK